jgi:hypothetical protein
MGEIAVVAVGSGAKHAVTRVIRDAISGRGQPPVIWGGASGVALGLGRPLRGNFPHIGEIAVIAVVAVVYGAKHAVTHVISGARFPV